MIKNFKSLNNIIGSRYYSSKDIGHTTLVSNGFGGLLNIMGQNQTVKYSTPITQSNGTVFVEHQVESKTYEPTIITTKKIFTHQLTEEQIEQVQKLRSTMSQKQLAEKFQTTPYIISRVSQCDPEKRQLLMDQYKIKSPKVIEASDVKSKRLQDWFAQNQQREYDQKVLKAASSFERIRLQKRELNEHNERSHQESFNLITSSQKSRFEANKPKIFTMEEKKAKAKELSKLRRRKVITEKDKQNESLQRTKNRSEKKSIKSKQ